MEIVVEIDRRIDEAAGLLLFLGSINFGVGGNQRLFLLSIKKET